MNLFPRLSQKEIIEKIENNDFLKQFWSDLDSLKENSLSDRNTHGDLSSLIYYGDDELVSNLFLYYVEIVYETNQEDAIASIAYFRRLFDKNFNFNIFDENEIKAVIFWLIYLIKTGDIDVGKIIENFPQKNSLILLNLFKINNDNYDDGCYNSVKLNYDVEIESVIIKSNDKNKRFDKYVMDYELRKWEVQDKDFLARLVGDEIKSRLRVVKKTFESKRGSENVNLKCEEKYLNKKMTIMNQLCESIVVEFNHETHCLDFINNDEGINSGAILQSIPLDLLKTMTSGDAARYIGVAIIDNHKHLKHLFDDVEAPQA